MRNHETSAEAADAAFDSLTMTVSNKRWMAATWRVDEKGDVHLSRTTSNFPKKRFLKALTLLTSQLDMELPPDDDEKEPEELPLARHLRVTTIEMQEDEGPLLDVNQELEELADDRMDQENSYDVD